MLRWGIVGTGFISHTVIDAIAGFYTGRFLTRCYQGDEHARGVRELEASREIFRSIDHDALAAKVEAALSAARS